MQTLARIDATCRSHKGHYQTYQSACNNIKLSAKNMKNAYFKLPHG